MNHYEAKQAARKDRLEARADRLSAQANSAFKRADLSEAATGIPFGQPILVGHHSEGRHRAVLKRADAAMRKGIELSKAAKEAAGRAAGVGSGGISSDDPDAVVKLAAELLRLEGLQAKRKAINAAIRKHAKAGVDAQVVALRELGHGESFARQLLVPDFMGRQGVADYQITNAGANIRRIKARIEDLRAAAKREHKEAEGPAGLKMVENADMNRLQLIFPGKPPAEVIKALKSYGFRWAPSEGAWQRHLSHGAVYAGQQVAKVWEASQ